jgi:hypothetical protein
MIRYHFSEIMVRPNLTISSKDGRERALGYSRKLRRSVVPRDAHSPSRQPLNLDFRVANACPHGDFWKRTTTCQSTVLLST